MSSIKWSFAWNYPAWINAKYTNSMLTLTALQKVNGHICHAIFTHSSTGFFSFNWSTASSNLVSTYYIFDWLPTEMPISLLWIRFFKWSEFVSQDKMNILLWWLDRKNAFVIFSWFFVLFQSVSIAFMIIKNRDLIW